MLTLHIDNPEVESFFHQNPAEIMSALEAMASHKAKPNNTSQYVIDIRNDIEEYKNGTLKSAPLDKAFWDEMDKHIDSDN